MAFKNTVPAERLAQAKEATSQVATLAQPRQSNYQPGYIKGGTLIGEVTEVLDKDSNDCQRYRLKILSSQSKAETGLYIEGAVLADDTDDELEVGARVAVSLTASHVPVIMTGRPSSAIGDGFPVEAWSWLNDVDVDET